MPAWSTSTVGVRSSRDAWRRALAFALTTLVATAIAILTLAPVSVLNGLPANDKVYHLIAFAVLVLPGAVLYPRGLALVLPFAIVFGGAIEIIQPVVGRNGEWHDFNADVAGVGIGVLLGLCARGGMNRIVARAANRT
jgi:uncharacterized membrane protein